jgi:hypothetical protein
MAVYKTAAVAAEPTWQNFICNNAPACMERLLELEVFPSLVPKHIRPARAASLLSSLLLLYS